MDKFGKAAVQVEKIVGNECENQREGVRARILKVGGFSMLE